MTKTELVDFDNTSYFHGKSLFVRFLWIVVSSFFFETSIPLPMALKIHALRFFGAKIGKGVVVKPNVKIKQPWFLVLGDYCWLGEGIWIDNLVFVRMASNVCISQGAFLLTGNHNYKSSSFDLMTGEINIGDGVWIGAKSIVGPGVKCKNHSVLSAGSATFSDLEQFSIYQGNPAIFKRKRVIFRKKSSG
jgi:putative colanic acid biosynthesis acetyltransferase WcaF